MSLKPDYGLRLVKEGVSKDVDLFFHDFRLYNLMVLGRGRYSTVAELPYEGELHALSLDMDDRQLADVLSNACFKLREYINEQLAHDPDTPRGIDFNDEVSFAVRARLGDLQTGRSEKFVPLKAQEIL